MTFLKRVSELELIPKWYGIAYRERHICEAVCAPVPFNWIVGWAHHAYWRIVKGPKHLYNEAFQAGYAAAERSLGYQHRQHVEEITRESMSQARKQVYDELTAFADKTWRADLTLTEKKH